MMNILDIKSCIDFFFPLRFSSLYGKDTDLTVLSMEDAKLQLLLYILLNESKREEDEKKIYVAKIWWLYNAKCEKDFFIFHFGFVLLKTHRQKKNWKKRSDFVKKMSNAILALFENNMMSSHC